MLTSNPGDVQTTNPAGCDLSVAGTLECFIDYDVRLSSYNGTLALQTSG